MEQNYFQYISEHLEKNPRINELKEALISFSRENHQPVYLIDTPLLDKQEFSYEYELAAVILIPNRKFFFLNFGNQNDDAFKKYANNFLEDLNSLISKYKFQKKIGRLSDIKEKIIEFANINNQEELIKKIQNRTLDSSLIRKTNIILSLAIGSVNNANSFVPQEATNTLDKIKNQIILFDSDQTSFMYKDKPQKKITVQGLAGTGKTELLFHKLVNLYVSGISDKTKIAFTFYNQILEHKTHNRVISFFDYMQVSEQIKWNERLWVMRGWGSASDGNSGVYAFICQYYGIPFQRFQRFPKIDFDKVCHDALILLRQMDDFEPCFDDILIDESQDFPESFFDLCEKVTKDKVIIAGDIFQNIFSNLNEKTIQPDFLLNRVYRNDPRTFMFAQSVGFALQEKKVIRWLSDKEWQSCGYIVQKNQNSTPIEYSLTRAPIRRFENIDENENAIDIVLSKKEEIVGNIINTIKNLKKDNPTMCPSDVAVIFLTEKNESIGYQQANEVSDKLDTTFHWKSNKGYETRNTDAENVVFISNQNNIKGLEFPFVICVVNGELKSDKVLDRNALYMMLTRSFVSSKLLLSNNDENKEFYSTYKKVVDLLLQEKKLTVKKPTKDNIISKDVLKNLASAVNMSHDELVLHELTSSLSIDESSISQNTIRKITSIMQQMDVDLDNPNDISDYIENNKKRLKQMIKS